MLIRVIRACTTGGGLMRWWPGDVLHVDDELAAHGHARCVTHREAGALIAAGFAVDVLREAGVPYMTRMVRCG